MSARNCDHKGRWRCITIGFRVSPEEAFRIDMEAKTSGYTKQDFICQRLLNANITVRPNIRIQRYLEDYLIKLIHELKRLERFEENPDILDNITYIVELVSKMTPM